MKQQHYSSGMISDIGVYCLSQINSRQTNKNDREEKSFSLCYDYFWMTKPSFRAICSPQIRLEMLLTMISFLRSVLIKINVASETTK